MKEVLQLIRERRSVRRYKREMVPDEMLAEILTAARWAPSWANTQCWEIVVVRDGEIKKELQAVLSSRNPASRAVGDAPVVLALCGRDRQSGFYDGRPVTALGDWKMYDLGLATQNILLAAASLGLATVVVGAFDHARAAEILQLPPGVQVVTLVPLGFADHAPGPTKRRPVEDFVHYNTY